MAKVIFTQFSNISKPVNTSAPEVILTQGGVAFAYGDNVIPDGIIAVRLMFYLDGDVTDPVTFRLRYTTDPTSAVGTEVLSRVVSSGNGQFIDTGYSTPIADPVGVQYLVMTTQNPDTISGLSVEQVTLHLLALPVTTETITLPFLISIEPALIERKAKVDVSLDPPPSGIFSYQEHAVDPPKNDTSPFADAGIQAVLNMNIAEPIRIPIDMNIA